MSPCSKRHASVAYIVKKHRCSDLTRLFSSFPLHLLIGGLIRSVVPIHLRPFGILLLVEMLARLRPSFGGDMGRGSVASFGMVVEANGEAVTAVTKVTT